MVLKFCDDASGRCSDLIQLCHQGQCTSKLVILSYSAVLIYRGDVCYTCACFFLLCEQVGVLTAVSKLCCTAPRVCNRVRKRIGSQSELTGSLYLINPPTGSGSRVK